MGCRRKVLNASLKHINLWSCLQLRFLRINYQQNCILGQHSLLTHFPSLLLGEIKTVQLLCSHKTQPSKFSALVLYIIKSLLVKIIHRQNLL